MRSVDQVLVSLWKKNISENSDWAFRAAQRIVLEAEKNPNTKGIGLSNSDKAIVTGIVRHKYQQGFISGRQSHVLMKVMPKYAAQLMRIKREHDVNEKALGEERVQVPPEG